MRKVCKPVAQRGKERGFDWLTHVCQEQNLRHLLSVQLRRRSLRQFKMMCLRIPHIVAFGQQQDTQRSAQILDKFRERNTGIGEAVFF